jgi:hypothetical protein
LYLGHPAKLGIQEWLSAIVVAGFRFTFYLIGSVALAAIAIGSLICGNRQSLHYWVL